MRGWCTLGLLLAAACPERVALAQDAYGARATVQAPRRAGSRSADARAAHSHPGALGEPARVLLDAAGVGRGSVRGSEPSVWGATGSESKVYLDGVQIPKLFHAGGLRTTVHPALTERVTLTPGAPEAAYGRGTGAVFELSTPRSLPRGQHGALRVDGIDSSLAFSSASRGVEVLLAARQGYLDRLAELLFADAREVLPLPSHADAAARVRVRIDAATSLTATWSYARERVRIERDDALQHRRTRGWFQLASLALEQRYHDGARMRIAPFATVAEDDERERFAAVPLRRGQDVTAFGLRAEYVRPDPRLELRLGVDARSERTRNERAGTLTLPAREGDIQLFGQAPVEAVASDRFTAWQINVAPHVGLTWRRGAWEVAPALRLESYLISAARARPRVPGVPAVGRDRMHVLPEPRLRVSYRPRDWASLEARAALLHQPPDAHDLSAVFGNPGLSPSRAVHVLAGASFSLPAALELELLGYYKWLDQLALRDDAPQPELARALLARGRGHSAGASLALRRAPGDGPFGDAVYTVSRNLRSDPDGSLRAFDHDQTHVFALLLGHAQPRWLVSLRARAGSGDPRTSLVGSYLDSTSGAVQPLFAGHNRARIPAFFQLDLHAELRFAVHDVQLALWLDLWNVTHRVNVEQVAYTPDLSRRRDLRGLPFLALAGLRLEI